MSFVEHGEIKWRQTSDGFRNNFAGLISGEYQAHRVGRTLKKTPHIVTLGRDGKVEVGRTNQQRIFLSLDGRVGTDA